MIEETKASQVYLIGEKKDTVVIPENMSASIRYDKSLASTVITIGENPYAWENNLCAYRLYGPALETSKEKLITPGIDVWVKCTEKLVIDEWYAKGDYHHNYGEGMDCYKVGNTLGGVFCYWLGYLGKMEWIERWLKVKKESLDKVESFVRRYGAWMGVFGVLPWVGEAIIVMLGLMRSNVYLTTLTMFIGKAIRYALIILAIEGVNSLI